MGKKLCAVLSCNNTGKENLGIKFHRFPSDQNVFEQKGLDSVKYKVICAILSLNLPASVYCNKTVLDKQDKTSIWRPNVLSPLLKKMLNNTKLDGRPFSQQPKVLSPKVNKMLSNIIENVDKSLQQSEDTSCSSISKSSINLTIDYKNNIMDDEDLGVYNLVDENTPYSENVFSVVRSKGGNNVTPDATKFHSAIRMCMCNTLLEPSKSGNCESEGDAVQFLTKCNFLNLHLSSMNIENILMENHEACAIGYVAGWVCSKLNHQECVDKLAAKSDDNSQVNLENTHIEMKSYQNANLLYPFKNTLEFAKNVTCIFNLNIESLLLKNKTGVRKEIIKIVDVACRPLNICDECETEFLKKLLNVLINSFIKNSNNNIDVFKMYSKN
ncbi:hypothetical protein QTP88_015213 [Uroleucon formosanum]